MQQFHVKFRLYLRKRGIQCSCDFTRNLGNIRISTRHFAIAPRDSMITQRICAAYLTSQKIVYYRLKRLSLLTLHRAATAGKAGKVWPLLRFWVSIRSYKKQPVRKMLGQNIGPCLAQIYRGGLVCGDCLIMLETFLTSHYRRVFNSYLRSVIIWFRLKRQNSIKIFFEDK